MMTEHLVDRLTPREADVLRLMAQGMMNKEIAAELHLTKDSVRWFIRQVYAKLQIADDLLPRDKRQAAIKQGKALGYIADDRPPVKHNLPADTTPFIGREKELTELAQLLDDSAIRHITILAPGGMGKTRLALALAGNWAQSIVLLQNTVFSNGIFFVPLAPLSDPANIISAIAEHTGYQFQQDNREPKQQLLDYLREKQMLLIMDNFEHLLADASIVTEILQAAPNVKIIVTSREKLKLSGEKVYTVSGMEFPDWETPEDALEYDAVKLFMQGAKLASTEFRLHAADLKFLARICRLTEGMPLAILLAAAWIEVLTLEEIASEIQQSGDFLAAEMRDIPRRHWSIRAVFEPTWDRLTQAEQSVFMKFSVFRGGCTREAAQTIIGAELRTLQSLLNKSLISRTTESRYEMHELLRQFADEKLIRGGEAKPTGDAHMAYYAEAMQERSLDLKGRRQIAALNEIESDFENVKVAWHWALEQQHFDAIERMTQSLYDYVRIRDLITDYDLFDVAMQALQAHDQTSDSALYGKLLTRYGSLLLRDSKQYEKTQKYLQKGLFLAHAVADEQEIAFALLEISRFIFPTDSVHADELLEQALQLYEKLQDQSGIGYCLFHKAFRLINDPIKCNLLESTRLNFQVKDMFQRLGDISGLVRTIYNLGDTLKHLGEYSRALALYDETLPLAQQLKSEYRSALLSANRAENLTLQGSFAQARTLFEDAIAITRQLGFPADTRNLGDLADTISSMGDHQLALDTASQINLPTYKYRIQGFIAYRMGEFHQSVELLDKGLQEPDSNLFRKSFAKIWRGLAQIQLNNMEQAVQDLTEGIQTGYDARTFWMMLSLGLYGFAAIFARTGQEERAVRICGALLETEALPYEQRIWAQNLLAELKDQLDHEPYHTAYEHGRTLDLEMVVKELLDEFGDEDKKERH